MVTQKRKSKQPLKVVQKETEEPRSTRKIIIVVLAMIGLLTAVTFVLAYIYMLAETGDVAESNSVVTRFIRDFFQILIDSDVGS